METREPILSNASLQKLEETLCFVKVFMCPYFSRSEDGRHWLFYIWFITSFVSSIYGYIWDIKVCNSHKNQEKENEWPFHLTLQVTIFVKSMCEMSTPWIDILSTYVNCIDSCGDIETVIERLRQLTRYRDRYQDIETHI